MRPLYSEIEVLQMSHEVESGDGAADWKSRSGDGELHGQSDSLTHSLSESSDRDLISERSDVVIVGGPRWLQS